MRRRILHQELGWAQSATAALRPTPISALRNYTKNLLDLGCTENDLVDGGSDRLTDAVISQGSAEQIAEVVPPHLDAGRGSRLPSAAGRRGHPAQVLDHARQRLV